MEHLLNDYHRCTRKSQTFNAFKTKIVIAFNPHFILVIDELVLQSCVLYLTGSSSPYPEKEPMLGKIEKCDGSCECPPTPYSLVSKHSRKHNTTQHGP